MRESTKRYYTVITTPLGGFRLVADDNYLLRANFLEQEEELAEPHIMMPAERHPVLTQAAEEFMAYFAGTLQYFTVPYIFASIPFRKRVWTELARIPYGQTISYQALAERIGNPKACRAVGQANHHNPLTIIIPCHRVIGKNGDLVGYGSGLTKKEWLLDWEAKCLSKQTGRTSRL